MFTETSIVEAGVGIPKLKVEVRVFSYGESSPAHVHRSQDTVDWFGVFVSDYVTGEETKIYHTCCYKNTEGRCIDFEPVEVNKGYFDEHR